MLYGKSGCSTVPRWVSTSWSRGWLPIVDVASAKVKALGVEVAAAERLVLLAGDALLGAISQGSDAGRVEDSAPDTVRQRLAPHAALAADLHDARRVEHDAADAVGQRRRQKGQHI